MNHVQCVVLYNIVVRVWTAAAWRVDLRSLDYNEIEKREKQIIIRKIAGPTTIVAHVWSAAALPYNRIKIILH